MKLEINEFLVNHYQKCGIEEGDTVLIHSSIRRILTTVKAEFNVLINAEQIFDSLLSAVGDKGTLLFPLFNFDFTTSHFFDIRSTPSQMGALTEVARNFQGAVRTGHPIYSFAIIGNKANEFEGINNKSGYGADSPFAKLRELDGKIAVFNLPDQTSMTSYHYVEECNLVDYRYFKDFIGKYIDQEGKENEVTYKLFVRNIEKGVKTDVNRMMAFLWEVGAYKGERHDEGLGLRTIRINDLFHHTDKIIKEGKAINYLYSIENEGAN